MSMLADPYSFGVLRPEHHDRLVADLVGFAYDAGIQPQHICTPLPDIVTEAERNYLRKFRSLRSNGVSGMVLTGKNVNGKVEHRMAAFAGALVRNFIRARVMTLGTVLDHLPRHDMPSVSALLVPNFFSPANDAGSVASWQLSALYDHLLFRHMNGLQTILYASDLDLMAKEYGMTFRRHLDCHFVNVQI